MILLLGGTSETAQVANALTRVGFSVLVSTATDAQLELGNDPAITRRCGILNQSAMTELATRCAARAIVDIGHPYASKLHETAQRVAEKLVLPYFCLFRGLTTDCYKAIRVADHEQAAQVACRLGKPVVVTTGSRNLKPYVREAARQGIRLAVRVLDHPDSIEACHAAGLRDDSIVLGRGPFTVDDNLALIQRFNAGVLVTKDSGESGGMAAKIEAVRALGIILVVLDRPKDERKCASSIDELVASILSVLGVAAQPAD